MGCVQALNTGSLAWSTCTGLAYWYMVASWGGYSFVINIIPIHVLVCIFTGRLSSRLYIAFAPFIIMGTLEAGATRFQSIPLHRNAVSLLHCSSFVQTSVLETLDRSECCTHSANLCAAAPLLLFQGGSPVVRKAHAMFANAASIPVVGFNAVLTSEHFGAFLAFGVLHAALAIGYIKVPSPQIQ